MPSSSGSDSASSSMARRTPLHDRTNSESNRIGIRLVPYTPPRLDPEADEDIENIKPEAQLAAAGSHYTDLRKSTPSPSEWRGSRISQGGQGSYFGSTSTARPKSPRKADGRPVSQGRQAHDSTGAGRPLSPRTPVRRRVSNDGNVASIHADTHSAQPPLPMPQREEEQESESPEWSGHNVPRSRRENVISVHSDKTFSVVLKPTGIRPSNETASSSRTRSTAISTKSAKSTKDTTFSTTHEEAISEVSSDRGDNQLSSPPSSPLAADHTYPSSSQAGLDRADDENINATDSSPWNYRMTGGLRKVVATPDLKGKGKALAIATDSSPPPLPTLRPQEPQTPSRKSSRTVLAKNSFDSDFSHQSQATLERSTNYKVIGRSSPPLPEWESGSLEATTPSSNYSDSNYRVLGESSPPGSVSYPEHGQHGLELDSPGSRNFIVYGDGTATHSRSSSFATLPRRPRHQYSSDSLILHSQYSQESLRVAPLNTTGRRRRRHSNANEHFVSGAQAQRREALHSHSRAHSFSTISSVITETPSVSSDSPNVIQLNANTPSVSSLREASSSWATETRPPRTIPPRRARMEEHPHIWSSQLSTVMSESEGSDRNSRALSQSTVGTPRRDSRSSRLVLSVSSLSATAEILDLDAEIEAEAEAEGEGSSGPRQPNPAYLRGTGELPSPGRIVRDHDEHGDGIADLQGLQHKGSRSRLPRVLQKKSDRSLRSSSSRTSLRTSSSRTSLRSNSLTPASIPTWARLYYGSGERPWLRGTGASLRSDAADSRPGSSRPGSAWDAESNSTSPDDAQVVNPRRRPREVRPRHDDMPIEPSHGRLRSIRRGVHKVASSIRTPQLHTDRRASRYSLWQPPSVTWSQDNGVFGRRNLQIVLFALGFIFPFAWMIGALLPLPPKPSPEMFERDNSRTMFGNPDEEFGPPRNSLGVEFEDAKHYSARWWRTVNRCMSVVGLLILGAVAALVYVGIKQWNWGQT